MKLYNPKEIEPKWLQWWDEQKTYLANLDSDKPKYIAMSMFNYPSGAGLHVGHAFNYTISDVIARAKRQQGFESYHPVGWDSFGLPAENYAIKAGVSPQSSMATIIPNYHKQYKAMGWSNDWSKEIASHTPEYYRWTQWVFAEMYKAGLVYQDARHQWWCDKCQTVLANEQIDAAGKCWRHDGVDDAMVAKREVKQWFFRITDYADEILQATDTLDWSESVKLAQKNWIGKSEGAEVIFKVEGLGAKDETIEAFTTAHDTIYGVTFIVLSPEHPLVTKYGQLADNAVDIEEYVSTAIRKSEVERLSEKHKKGVQIEGLLAINPLSGQKISIWVAEYVLSGYGTGAIMAVPGEDERDYEFATKYSLPIVYTTEQQEFISYSESIKPNRKTYKLANSGEFDGLDFELGRQKILDKIVSTGSGKAVTQFKIRDWSVTRQRYWGAPTPIIHCHDCGPVLVPDKNLPVLLPELEDFAPSGDGRSALARATGWLKADCPECSKPGERETDTLDTYICSSWYMLRYLDPKNKDAAFGSDMANKWMPIDFYNGGDHATAHLIYARFITRFFHKQGLLDNPEPFKRFLFNGKIMASDGTMFSKSKGNGVDPLEIINSGYGADALRTYLMFAAPLDLWVKWDANGVPGAYRFLNRVWNLVQEFLNTESLESRVLSQERLHAIINPVIKKVTEDIDSQKYNTAIATLMKCCNDLHLIKAKDGYTDKDGWQSTLESLVMLIAPFAPHTAEELWHDLGHQDSVNKDHWPKINEKYLVSDSVTIGVQINGKVRGQITIAPGCSEKEAIIAAAEILKDQVIKKIIYVPSRILNIVV
jgi:leucyl-tRNA synthetase